jgi:hypothetical protein
MCLRVAGSGTSSWQDRWSGSFAGTGYVTPEFRRDEVESTCGLSFEVT